MKKFFVLAAAAIALCACETADPQVDGAKPEPKPFTGVVLNELSANDKYIELYNTTNEEIEVYGAYLVKYDSSKDGGKSVTWTAAEGMKIPANGYLVLESSDLADEAEGGNPDYKYETANHVFKGGLSGKKNVFIEFYDGKNNKLDTFKRGEEGAGWNQVSNFANNKTNTFSRVPNGTGNWAYAAPTKGTVNGDATGEIEQQPKVE